MSCFLLNKLLSVQILCKWIHSLSLMCVLAKSRLSVPGFQVEVKGCCKPDCSSAFAFVQHCHMGCGFILAFVILLISVSATAGGEVGVLFVLLMFVICVI